MAQTRCEQILTYRQGDSFIFQQTLFAAREMVVNIAGKRTFHPKFTETLILCLRL